MFSTRRIRTGATDAAGTVNIAVEESGLGARQITLYGIFDYGSGGTTIKCYLQGSFDGGTTWVSIGNMTFALADDNKLLSISPASTAVIDADATQADNTVLSFTAPRLRVQVVTAGTYAGSTLELWLSMVG